MYLLLYSFLYTVHFVVVTSQKIFISCIRFISCISTTSLSCIQTFLSQMELVKTLFRTQLKQTNLQNWLHIITESSKEGFNDIAFQYFVDELKHYNKYMKTDLQLVPVFLYLYDPFSKRVLLYFFFSWLCNILVPHFKTHL